jgi:PAS domain S-box-containing protein
MSKQLHVLLVEDSEDDALLLLRELKKGGYQVEYERVDTPDAMSAALDSRKWNIIIADYIMPHFNGLSALKLLKKKEIDLPFILVSGKIEEDIAVDAMKAGAQDFINKHNLTRLVPAIGRELAEADVRLKRKLAEEELRKSEEKYRMIVETTHEGIWMLDPSEKTSYVNSRMAQMLGYTEQEMLGRHLFDFMDAPARIDAQIYLERRKQGITETHDFRFSRKDGTDMWAIANVNPIIDEKGQYVGALGMITDISERKRAEKALRKAEADIRTIYNSITGHLTVVDRNYRIVNYNLTVERKFGKDLIGKVCYEVYQARKEICPGCAVKKTLETGKHAFTFQPATPVSSPVDIYTYPIFDEKGEIVAVIEHGIVVTERVKAEEALRQSEMELKESQRVARVGSWKWIIASDTIVFSEGLYRIIGRDPALPPSNYKENLKMYTPESTALLEAAVAEAVKNGTPFELDLEMFHPDGSRRFMIERGEAIRDAAGQVVMLRGTLQDITERKKREEEIRKLNEGLEQRVRERTAELEKKNMELERFNKVFVGRELRMIELKKQITKLEKELEEIKKNCSGQAEEKIWGTV